MYIQKRIIKLVNRIVFKIKHTVSQNSSINSRDDVLIFSLCIHITIPHATTASTPDAFTASATIHEAYAAMIVNKHSCILLSYIILIVHLDIEPIIEPTIPATKIKRKKKPTVSPGVGGRSTQPAMCSAGSSSHNKCGTSKLA